ncbi:MAG: nucleoside 2-deoxyribosyltransferase [Candidatus Paceibacterota bacterium]|jgi:nucleoside 2-deoxyribosyltransferase
MKIYFAGSIRGGRDDAHIYEKIIELLKNYGEVLTEHIGDKTLSSQGEDKSHEYIYKRDIEWLRSADVLVADISTPSVGVGYEIGIAEALNKKVLCLYREGSPKPISGMINGDYNLIKKVYKNIDELPVIIKEFFDK